MELYIARAVSNLPQNTLFTQTQTRLQWKTSLPFRRTSISRPNTGLRYYREEYFKALRSKLSEETSTEGTKIVNEEAEADGDVPVAIVNEEAEADGDVPVAIVNEEAEADGDVPVVIVNEEADSAVPVVDVQSAENNAYEKTESNEKVFSGDGEVKPFEFLDNLNLELDFEKDSYLILLYGGGSLFALWLASAVVGAIDSIPLIPKLLEIVGLSHTLWFTTRYLLFKKTRDELFAKVGEIKREVVGSDDA